MEERTAPVFSSNEELTNMEEDSWTEFGQFKNSIGPVVLQNFVEYIPSFG